MQNLFGKLDPYIKLVFFLGIIGLAYANYSLFNKLKLIESNLKASPLSRLINLQTSSEGKEGEAAVTIIEGCGTDCQEKIKEEVSKEIARLVETTTPTPTQLKSVAPSSSQTKTPKQTSYIPLSASYSTTSTAWEDVNSASAWVDLKNDYSSGATVSFDASIRTESGSGKAFVRLYDATNNIAVIGSDLETTKAQSTLVSSGNLAFWAGRNLYRVQIRSLDSSKVFIDGARLKVTH